MELEEREEESLSDPVFEVREITLPDGGIESRLDAWLAGQWPDLSRARIQALIKGGGLTASCGGVKPNSRPAGGTRIRLEIPFPVPAVPEPQNIPLEVLYEDDDCLVVNKPPDLVVHPAPGHPDGTLVNALLYHCKNLGGIGGVERPGIVHRLDKDTSGLLAVAKNDLAMAGFVRLFQSGGILKEYVAWVHGTPQSESGTITTLIGRHPEFRQKMAVVKVNGRQAVTHYRVEKRCGDLLLMRCRIETGRTHQIRVHMRHIGCPVAGDPLYGWPASDRKLDPRPPRQLLHAEHLAFPHPVTGERVDLHAPLPKDFAPYFC